MKKHKKRLLFVIFLISIFFSSLTFAIKIESVKLQQDFDFLVLLLKEAYIDPDGLVKNQEFTEVVEDIRKKLEKPMDKLEFYKTVVPLFRYLNDYHCDIEIPSDILVFPFTLYVIDNDIYVSFSLIDDVPVKSKILKIDDISSKEIIKEFEQYLYIKNNADLKERFLSRYLTYIPTFWSKKSVKIEFEYNGVKKKIKIDAMTREEALKKVQKDKKISRTLYNFERKGNIGILRISTFKLGGRLFGDFKEFLKEIFEKNKDMSDLVIDIRRNSGGSLNSVLEVLGYLVKEELYVKYKERIKNSKYNIKILEAAGIRYDENTKGKLIEKSSALIIKPNVPTFEGKVWILIDRNIASAALVFTAIVQNNKLGKLIEKSSALIIKPNVPTFEGKVWILIDRNIASAALVFTAIVQNNKLGKVIGQRPVYSINSTMSGNIYYLPRVGFYVYIPGSYKYFPRYHEITLDYEFAMTKKEKLEWITSNSDPLLEKAIKLIENR
ncbi:hypothetical protein SU69_02130 [Thermosipho melanesiensis]|uniref:Peptidase S41 n=2 Tax=Thermosipho melanesiensis TaxID=46541 RepID=A6LK26_THEM4|nr:S41 family peptidase [Thermosipho melanesiensis]ABR30277.1 peptidase S41 [Thermosipho melanesiensis BI429]APT74817.1 hypothetical protein BW47_02225 [Thermosipho melanesiensis]OOC37402.1 hypothetical protein SU68_02140 [Thermosipho melanesiensis]OOC39764.1 hypothetical protein SU69_02130 [Thermosipho melanesiensis]OOC39869.1 hypothetical protein SU70_02125 [Thermosipho melanesiensis]